MKYNQQLDWENETPTSLCLISAYSIALQLVQNGFYKTREREPCRLVMQEVSELWRILTSSGKSISEDFSPEEFASAI